MVERAVKLARIRLEGKLSGSQTWKTIVFNKGDGQEPENVTCCPWDLFTRI